MSLYMLQFCPDMERLIRWAAGQRVLRDKDDLGYALHATLAATFDKLAPKPFALLQDPRRAPKLLAYSALPSAALCEHARDFAEPAVIAALGLDSLADKPMPERFAAGRRLGFTVRVRPMLRTDKDGDRGQAREIDAFLAAVIRAPKDEPLDRGRIYTDWLAARLQEGGARPERLVLQSFRRSRVLRRRQDSARQIKEQEGPDATFEGVLAVSDPEAFARLLARGIGRHRAFGFGMLLLRPA